MFDKGVNPFLPSWEYIPDGEAHVFGDRVYLYGSHDRFRGHAYCLGDYVCYSAPVSDLTTWRYEGVIYGRSDDPANADGEGCLYAPDVTRGTDGRYYLYYVLNNAEHVSVAVSGEPAGRYEYLGIVQHPDGTPLGSRGGDMPQFDPAVLTEGGVTYLYTGFAAPDDETRVGCTGVALAADMLTVIDGPRPVIPSVQHARGTSFESAGYFEGPSIRKAGDTYYLLYSAWGTWGLAYATSKEPLGGFEYRGVVISNADVGIGSYKPARALMGPGGNNHGCIEQIDGSWYVFNHRHTDGHQFSRQATMEPIEILPDGSIPQVEMTSCGPLGHGEILPGTGRFPGYIACNFYLADPEQRLEDRGFLFDWRLPRVTQDGRDGDEEIGYVANLSDGGGIGMKYFDLTGGPTTVAVQTRGNVNGSSLEVRTEPFSAAHGVIPLAESNEWATHSATIDLPGGKAALYLVYRGPAQMQLLSLAIAPANPG